VSERLETSRSRKELLERYQNVVITDEAIDASVYLTDKYVTDRRRPDKALDALDEACAQTQASAKYPPRAAALIRDRVRRLRDAATAHRDGGGQEQRTAAEDAQWQQMARDGMTALERFGAELEKMFAAPAGGAPGPA